jgi:hypothetical protein
MPATATAVVVLCLLAGAPIDAARQPEWWRDGGPRIRPSDPRAAELLQAGIARSATLRRLVAYVDASNVVVYVGIGPNMGPEQAGGLTFVGDGGQYRYLRISLNPAQSTEQLIATLGHELQHVVEVIDNPSVKDERSLVSLYRRIGIPSRILRGFGWETQAAQAVGADVRRELTQSAVETVAEVRRSVEK